MPHHRTCNSTNVLLRLQIKVAMVSIQQWIISWSRNQQVTVHRFRSAHLFMFFLLMTLLYLDVLPVQNHISSHISLPSLQSLFSSRGLSLVRALLFLRLCWCGWVRGRGLQLLRWRFRVISTRGLRGKLTQLRQQSFIGWTFFARIIFAKYTWDKIFLFQRREEAYIEK